MAFETTDLDLAKDVYAAASNEETYTAAVQVEIAEMEGLDEVPVLESMEDPTAPAIVGNSNFIFIRIEP